MGKDWLHGIFCMLGDVRLSIIRWTPLDSWRQENSDFHGSCHPLSAMWSFQTCSVFSVPGSDTAPPSYIFLLEQSTLISYLTHRPHPLSCDILCILPEPCLGRQKGLQQESDRVDRKGHTERCYSVFAIFQLCVCAHEAPILTSLHLDHFLPRPWYSFP